MENNCSPVCPGEFPDRISSLGELKMRKMHGTFSSQLLNAWIFISETKHTHTHTHTLSSHVYEQAVFFMHTGSRGWSNKKPMLILEAPWLIYLYTLKATSLLFSFQ
jgi:hypothetical protein